jgi:hypothetical protein
MRHVTGSDTSVRNIPSVVTSPFDRQRYKGGRELNPGVVVVVGANGDTPSPLPRKTAVLLGG